MEREKREKETDSFIASLSREPLQPPPILLPHTTLSTPHEEPGFCTHDDDRRRFTAPRFLTRAQLLPEFPTALKPDVPPFCFHLMRSSLLSKTIIFPSSGQRRGAVADDNAGRHPRHRSYALVAPARRAQTHRQRDAADQPAAGFEAGRDEVGAAVRGVHGAPRGLWAAGPRYTSCRLVSCPRVRDSHRRL